MNKNEKNQQLFERLRQSPTELSLRQVNTLINGLPHLPSKPIGSRNWKNFLNLNNIIMGTIFLVISFSLLTFLGGPTNLQKNVSSNEINKESVQVQKEVKEGSDQKKEPLNINHQKSNPTTTKKTITSTIESSISAPKNSMEEIDSTLDNDLSTSNTLSPSTKKSSPSILKKNNLGTSISVPIIKEDPSPYPDLNNLELRKIKRTLRRNLRADGIIPSKSIDLLIELPGNQIIVNGTVLDQNLFLKYQDLTKKAGHGPHRKIEIDNKFIAVGDFTPDGFKGSGVGTFTKEFTDQTEVGLFDTKEEQPKKISEKEKQEAALKLEQKNLKLFSENILDQQANSKGRGNLFGVNLKNHKTKKLFFELQSLLKEDQLLDEPTEFALIEMPKNVIRINGKKLNDPLYLKYSKLFEEYKIKRGTNRQIRLSEHSIQIGDQIRNGFKGTFQTFNNDELRNR